MVPKAISFPCCENFSEPSKVTSLKTLEAKAKPNNLGICPAVGEMSEEIFFILVKSFQLPSEFRERVAKWQGICLPADAGSLSTLVSA